MPGAQGAFLSFASEYSESFSARKNSFRRKEKGRFSRMGLAKTGKYAKMDAVLFREKIYHPQREFAEPSVIFGRCFPK